jgi:hypothetical protein
MAVEQMGVTQGRQLMRWIGRPVIGFLPSPVMVKPHLP